MGLDTTHDCWHGAYSSFNKFRRFLASQIGVDLDKCEGYGGDIEFSSIDHDIVPLLDHSDCDGILTSSECGQIYNGLNDISEKLYIEINHKGNTDPELQYYLDKIYQFRDGCLLAASNGENVEFH
jgi:hypothetical protein